ncbi:translocation/assembly module TamB domain-containing protein [Algicella marina]|uniref:Translocation and assembly module TamB C-terminal domain-containing protein n=1 Tax=Algicella marina TaxID=2683284 RepID=A0A6P1T1K3_9RHOB|nr:translocation/assembly module TamB domain-containing protein [Algicella marina]QHQ36618.1 hypothetical protein GO499_16275 [Algicella marina]
MRFIPLLALIVPLALPVQAQDEVEAGDDDNGFIINLLEDQLSTETRTIRLSGVSGVLSSSASVKRITISDPEGIWLQIDDAVIDWNRSALLRGRVEVEELSAERIAIPRKPIPDPNALPQAEAEPFSVPDLPVSIELGGLKIDQLVFGEALFGLAAEMEVEGALSIIDGEFETTLAMQRLDGPGGEFDLAASFSSASEELNVDLKFAEPPEGILASALNLPERPAVNLEVQGSGPLSDIEIVLALEVDESPLAQGNLHLFQNEGLQAFEADLTGQLQNIVPAEYAPFFAGDASVAAAGTARADGGFAVSQFSVVTGGLNLNGSAVTEASGFLASAQLNGTVGSPNGDALTLPFGGGDTTVQGGTLTFSFGQGSGDEWGGEFELHDLVSGDVRAADVRLAIDGEAQNLQEPAARALSGDVTAAISGITSPRAEIAEALGERIDASAAFAWQANAPVTLENLVIAGSGVSLNAAGEFADLMFDGKVEARVTDLAPFANLAGRNLGGSVSFSSEGSVSPVSGAFDLELQGQTDGLMIGEPQADVLLSGLTSLSGQIARNENGISADSFSISNDQIQLTAQGRYASTDTDFALTAALADIGLLTPNGSGEVSVIAQAIGPADRINLQAELTMPSGRMVERSVEGLKVGFFGEIENGGQIIDGSLRGEGMIGDAALNLRGMLAVDDRLRAFKDFALSLGETEVSGTVGQGADGKFAGSARVISPDLSVPAALALMEVEGSADLRTVISRSGGGQRLEVAGYVNDLAVGGQQIRALDLNVDVLDIFGVPLAAGTARASGAVLGGQEIEDLSLSAERSGQAMDLKASGRLVRGTEFVLAGGLSNLDPGYRLDLSDLVLRDGEHEAVLQEPATLSVVGTSIDFTPLELSVDEGSLRAAGSLDEQWDISVDIANLPLSVADLVVPDLAVRGQVTGRAEIGGPKANPDIDFQLDATGLTAAPITQQGLPELNVSAQGRTDAKRLQVDASLQAGSVLDARIAGAVPLANEAGSFDLQGRIERLDLAIINAFAGDRGITGQANGEFTVAGTLESPTAGFSIAGTGISADAMRQNGVRPVAIRAEGDFADEVLTVRTAELTGGNGLQFNASGTVPITRQTVDISFRGNLPLSLANVALAEQATQISGTLTTNGNVRGPWSSPAFSGSATVNGGTIVDPLRNLRLNNLALNADYSGTGLNIRNISGQFEQGGSLQAQGRLGFGRGLPADLAMRIDNARYSDGELVQTTVSANLEINGPLLGDGRLSGQVDIGKTEITVPSSFGIREGVLLDVQHLSLPRDAAMTLQRAGLPEREEPSPAGSGSNLRLDITISAQNQIFVRGRGLDTELGGTVVVRGPISNVRPIGQFDLIRGRISILGQRIDFDEGSVNLSGDFDPRIRLVATTIATDTTVNLIVEGRVSDPEITLTSSPELPQDEVLALLIFQRNLSELTPFQVAQLATAAASLAGGGGGGLLDNLRSSTGLSNLDIVTGDDGEVGVRAGAYLRDNVYLDVEAEDDGDARATINIDITDSLRGRATFGNDGDSSIGIFYEKDY